MLVREDHEIIMDGISGAKAAFSGPVRLEEWLNAGRIVLQMSLSSIIPFLEGEKDASGLFQVNLSSSFAFETLHNLLFRISKLFKICLVGFVNSRALCTRA